MDKKQLTELEAQELLAQILNNTPIPITIADKTYQITSLKMGTQNLIAEEVCKIQRAKDNDMYDLYKQFAKSIPAVMRCLCYAVLNDKDRIFSDYAKREYSDEFNALYEDLEWCSDRDKWMEILIDVMKRIDLSFFMTGVSMVMTMKDSALKTKKPIHAST